MIKDGLHFLVAIWLILEATSEVVICERNKQSRTRRRLIRGRWKLQTQVISGDMAEQGPPMPAFH